MQSQMKLSAIIEDLLRCPICKARLQRSDERLLCTDSHCKTHFPIIDGIPILINENASIFSIHDYTSGHNTIFRRQENSKTRNLLRHTIPSISMNIKSKNNYKHFAKLLLNQSKAPKVLVIGGRTLGQGMKSFLTFQSIEIIESDISFGPRTMLICDAHSIPFEDGSFDGVVVQAVLEHVVDPYKCVDEIHRVLDKNGLVYAETPFIQQVHMGPYDFTRFTHIGQRRLFRKFEEIESGAVCGPGMALAWSYHHFLLSFTKSKILRKCITAFSGLTSFYLKYMDYYLINKSGTFDSASSFYFMGQKSDSILSDRELIKLYRGNM